MMYLHIIFWIIIAYITSIIIGRILTYASAILHNWCMMVAYDQHYWYNKGTTIKDIYNKISDGDNFRSSNEGKFYPIGNVLFPLIWLLGELAFFILIIFVSIIRFIIFMYIILHKIVYVKCLSKLLRPMGKCLSNINWQNTWIIKFIKLIITILYNIKKSFLNLRIA